MSKLDELKRRHPRDPRVVLAVWIALLLLSAPSALSVPSAALAGPRAGTVKSLTYGAGPTAHPYLVYTPARGGAGERGQEPPGARVADAQRLRS